MKTRFAVSLGANHGLYLDLGKVSGMAEVELNRKNLGVLWKPPFRVRVHVEGIARVGVSKLTIRITNLCRNRMLGNAALADDIEWKVSGKKGSYLAKWPDWLGDGKPRPAGRAAFCTRKDVDPENAPLLPSGRLGPVTLPSLAEGG